jgi:hypothetical protein
MKRTLIALGLLLAACSAAPQPIQQLKIAISPAVQPASAALLACLPADGNVAFIIDPLYPAAADLADYDFYLRLGEPAGAAGFAAQLASERIVLVLNPDQDLDSISPTDAAALFSGRVENWAEVGGEDEAVTLWIGPDSDEARVAFQAQVLRGALAGAAHIAGGPADLLAAVAGDSAAAGVLPAAWASDAVQAIELDITLPLLAVAAAEPQGAAHAVLACLQSGVGQNVLSETYSQP